MKKYILLIFIISFMTQINIFADDTIITTEGALDNGIIENEDIISSNVDWNKKGNYYVEYFNKQTKEISTKNIIITTNEELLTGVDFHNQYSVKNNDNISISKLLFVNEEEYFLYGSIDLGSYPYQSQNPMEYTYVAYYKNNVMQWYKIVNDVHYGRFTDGCLTEKGIALIGDQDTFSQNRNIVIYEISFNQEILLEKELSGNNDDFAHQIFYDNGWLYFTGESDSSDNDFSLFPDSDSNIIVGKLELKNSENCELNYFGNSGKDVYYNAKYANNNFYIFLKFMGEGYYYNNDYQTDYQGLIKVNNQLEAVDWVSVEGKNLLTKTSVCFLNGNFNLLTYDDQSNSFTFHFLNDKLELQKSKTIQIEAGYRIQYIDVFSRNNKIVVLCNVRDDSNREFNIVKILNEDYQSEITSVNSNNYLSFKSLGIYMSESGVITYGIWNMYQNSFDVNVYAHYLAVENTINYNNFVLYEKDIYINGLPLEYTLFENNITYNPYGIYTNLYRFSNVDTEIFLNMETYYPAKINVKNKEVYDIDVQIYFNGTGFLNDEKINPGYKITESGKYVLEIVGTNEERKIITFNVSPLSEETKEYIIKPSLELEMTGVDFPKEEKANNVEYQNLSNSYANEFDLGKIIVFSGITLGVVIGIFLPSKFYRFLKGNKNA